MQKSQGSYEKIILTIAALLAIGVAGYLIMLSRGFEESLVVEEGVARKELNLPNTPAMQEAIEMVQKANTWASPVRNGKPVPLNKSVLLVMKNNELFDLTLPEPQFRPPMTNVFVMGNKDATPPEEPLPHVFSPNVGELDADDDGFSNLEEFEGKTNPRDAQSHPPITNKLFLTKRISHDYIVKLGSGGDGTTFQVQRLQPEPRATKFVTLNTDFGFERGSVRFKATAASKKTIQHPTLGQKEVYVLKVTDLSTNKEFELEEGAEVNLAEYEAEFELRHKARQVIPGVREGKTFILPGSGTSYEVIKLEESSAIIAPKDKPDEKIVIKQG